MEEKMNRNICFIFCHAQPFTFCVTWFPLVRLPSVLEENSLQRQLETCVTSVSLGLQNTDDALQRALTSIRSLSLTSGLDNLSSTVDRVSVFEDILLLANKREAMWWESGVGIQSGVASLSWRMMLVTILTELLTAILARPCPPPDYSSH